MFWGMMHHGALQDLFFVKLLLSRAEEVAADFLNTEDQREAGKRRRQRK